MQIRSACLFPVLLEPAVLLQAEAASLLRKGPQCHHLLKSNTLAFMNASVVGGGHGAGSLCWGRIQPLLHLGSCAHHHDGCRLFPLPQVLRTDAL